MKQHTVESTKARVASIRRGLLVSTVTMTCRNNRGSDQLQPGHDKHSARARATWECDWPPGLQQQQKKQKKKTEQE